MANELRWILLAIGLLLIAGLWWWERRRPVPPGDESPLRSTDRYEPRLEAESAESAAAAVVAESREPVLLPQEPIRAVDERPVPRGDPPLVTLDDLPDNAEDVVLARSPPVLEERAVAPSTVAVDRRRARVEPPPIEPLVEAPVLEHSVEIDLEPEPVIEPEPQAPKAAEPPPRQQRIVAVRLIVAPDRRIDGGELKKALAAEGLEFGRYSIFHRILEGGRPIFSVASLLEPGSFDPDLMASIRFPGVSLFAVFPGPLPAPQAFDDLLATARRLADRLGASLQDDTGSSLTGQRVLSIREDLVHFEHLVTLSRSRPTL